MPDLTADLARLAAHIPCLERAAADPDAPAWARLRIAAVAALARTAVTAAGPVRMGADRPGLVRNENGTETNHGR